MVDLQFDNSEDEEEIEETKVKEPENVASGIQAELIDDELEKERREKEFIEQHVGSEFQHMFYPMSTKIKTENKKPQSSPTNVIEKKDSFTWMV